MLVWMFTGVVDKIRAMIESSSVAVALVVVEFVVVV